VIFEPLAVDGAFLVKPEPREDHRGFFARMYDRAIWEERGLDPTIQQCNASLTKKAGTVRGLHYQRDPHGETKLVRCTKGAIFDVVADARKGSPTYGTWAGVELTAENHAMLYVPKGCVHGFQALEDFSEIFYVVSTPFNKEADGGVRFDDPTFGVTWPLPPVELSDKDKTLPFLAEL
jgi:dTDP-4-dehydrorhamnose 3,5-epimerase